MQHNFKLQALLQKFQLYTLKLQVPQIYDTKWKVKSE